MHDELTLFDKIIRGDIPSHKVYEDEHVFAFLDIAPQSRGHTLVVPKESKAFLHELSPESSGAIGKILPRLCRAVMKASGASTYNVLQNNGAAAGQSVFHVHFHIIPRFADEGLQFSLQRHEPLTPELAAELLEKMRGALTDAP